MIRSFHEATKKEKALIMLISLGLIAMGLGLGIAFSGIL